MNKKHYFCALPFEHFEVNVNGDVYVCCPNRLPTAIGNLIDDNLMGVWNSAVAQEIRESVFDNSYRFCIESRCGVLQSGKLPEIDKVTQPHLKEIIHKKQTVLEYGPIKLNLGYDRTCNLSCPSCRKQPIVYTGEKLLKVQMIQDRILQEFPVNIERLIVSGHGDPFGSRLYRTLLQSLDSKSYPRMKIQLITNAQLLNGEMWESLNKIHNSIDWIYVSVDAATEKTYITNRKGGNFDRLLKNLEFIGTLRADSKVRRFDISFVVQSNNYNEMRSFVQLGKRVGCDTIVFTRILNWGTYTDEEYRDLAVHEETHPEHKNFVSIIKDPIFKDKIVYMSNLHDVVGQ